LRRRLREDDGGIWLFLRRRDAKRGLERRRRACADDFAGLGADAAEAVRTGSLEVIRVARAEDSSLAFDRHLEPAADDDAALLAVVHQRDAPGIAARPIALLQNLQRAAEQVFADLTERDRALADLGELVRSIERLARPV